eukprot:3661462-Pleurochrysis_carterae.AAC.1
MRTRSLFGRPSSHGAANLSRSSGVTTNGTPAPSKISTAVSTARQSGDTTTSSNLPKSCLSSSRAAATCARPSGVRAGSTVAKPAIETL